MFANFNFSLRQNRGWKEVLTELWTCFIDERLQGHRLMYSRQQSATSAYRAYPVPRSLSRWSGWVTDTEID